MAASMQRRQVIIKPITQTHARQGIAPISPTPNQGGAGPAHGSGTKFLFAPTSPNPVMCAQGIRKHARRRSGWTPRHKDHHQNTPARARRPPARATTHHLGDPGRDIDSHIRRSTFQHSVDRSTAPLENQRTPLHTACLHLCLILASWCVR